MTQRTEVHRLPQRGAYTRETIDPILDEGLVCHVGFVSDGTPFVIPTGYARHGDRLYIHGSSASRMMRALGAGLEACITITLVDGLVLARSAFHHSMNYRSVVILGRGRLVNDQAEKVLALEWITEHLVPGLVQRERKHRRGFQLLRHPPTIAISINQHRTTASGPP